MESSIFVLISNKGMQLQFKVNLRFYLSHLASKCVFIWVGFKSSKWPLNVFLYGRALKAPPQSMSIPEAPYGRVN